VELDEARLKVAQEDFPGIETYTRLDDLLAKSEADLVTLITPHNTHAPLGLQCLKAGRHVIIEKPMTITTEECDELIAEAKKNHLLLSTYHNRHWDGSVMRALEVIRAGEIGDVFRIEAHMGGYHQPGAWWRSSRTISGGILYDWGVHLLEYSLQILDSEILEVSGFAKTGFWAASTPYGDDTNEDEGFLTVRFKSGSWLTLDMSSVDTNAKDRDRGMLEITGTKGTYIWWYDRWQQKNILEDGETVIREGRNPHGQDEKYYQNVAAYLKGEEALIITPEWSRRPVHIIDLAVQSAKLGRALPAKYA